MSKTTTTQSGPDGAREDADAARNGRDTAAGSETAAQREAADAEALGAAGSQLSTAPREEALVNLPVLGVVGWIRWFWRQLTSMRVALILLFLLSLAAIPGSLIPQKGNDDLKVQDFLATHSTLGPLYDRLQLFQVFSSVWFSAIYILLFVSLIGCIVPRTWQFVGQLRSRPPGAPGRLTRLPAYTTWRTEATPGQVHEAALSVLRQRRYRAHTVAGTAPATGTGPATGAEPATGTSGGAGHGSVAGEKGYLREAGNLVFHVSLLVMLVAFAVGQLFNSEGSKLIVQGDGFSNTLTQYDDFTSGNLFDANDLAPFSFQLDKFVGTFERNGPGRGTARIFEAHVTYNEGVDGTSKKKVIEVNKPLEVDGSKVYLISHGYAPTVTVRDAKGKVVFRSATPLLPIDNNGTATGAIKIMDGYHDKNGRSEQLGFNAFFVPTFAGAGSGQMLSQFPELDNPVLALSAYHGSLGVDSGLPQNVYQLDTSKMKKFKDADGKLLKQRLHPGETMQLPNGAGSVTFDKNVQQWASFQISHQPGTGWALGGAMAAIAGLAGSLFLQRRRVWVRATAGEDGVTVVEMAGLGRSESAKLPEELGDLAALVHDRVPSAPGPDAGSAAGPEGARRTDSHSDDSDAVPASAEGAEK